MINKKETWPSSNLAFNIRPEGTPYNSMLSAPYNSMDQYILYYFEYNSCDLNVGKQGYLHICYKEVKVYNDNK